MGALADWRSCLILSIWTCVEVSMMMIALPPSSWASAHEHSRNETNPGLPAPWLSATYNVTSLPSWNDSPIKTRVADTDGPDSSPVSKYPYSMHPAADLHPSFSARVPPINNSTLTLGYLVGDRSKVHASSQDWKLVSGALAYAVHEINQDGIVPGYNLTFVVRNTHMQTNDSLLAMSNLWRDGVVGFIGSAASCQSEAMLAGAWNLPILAHLCSVDAVSDKQEYPTFVRTFPSADAIISPVVSLLQHFSWNKFSIIYGKSANKMDENLAETLKDAAGRYGLTVNHMRHYSDRELVTNSGEIFSKIVQETYIDTRIYVLLGALNALVDFMITLNSSGLLDGGEYEIIFVELVEGLAMEPNKYFKKTFWNVHKQNLLIEAARSLLVVKSSPHEGFEGFYDIVRHYNEQPPFSFRAPKAWTKRIPVQATCLYDAVMLYAYALRKVLEEGGSYNDGRAIVGKILGHAFRSIQGYFTKIDKNGNAEGNFTVLALQEHADNSSIVQDMFPVANFLMNDEGELPKFNLYEGVSLNWVSGKPPVAEPSCGYRGQKCVKEN